MAIGYRTVIGLLGGAAMLAAGAAAQAGETFRWTDDEGNVHYGDTLPPGQPTTGSAALDDQGMVVREPEAEGPDARAADEEARRTERTRAEERERDRVLIDSFADEQELIRTRDRRLKGIDGNIRRSRDWIANLEDQMERLRERAERLDTRDAPIPASLEERIESVQGQLDDHREHLQRQEAKREATEARFDSALERMKEIKAEE